MQWLSSLFCWKKEAKPIKDHWKQVNIREIYYRGIFFSPACQSKKQERIQSTTRYSTLSRSKQNYLHRWDFRWSRAYHDWWLLAPRQKKWKKDINRVLCVPKRKGYLVQYSRWRKERRYLCWSSIFARCNGI